MDSQNKELSPVVKHDIEELKFKINTFKEDKIPEEKFKHFRLTRGVYGQRQAGVQMLRIKIPYGRVNTTQLRKMAELSRKYTNGNLHLTTRQNIQFHYVKLDDSPEIWEELESVDITLREACGNTVRTVTGSPYAGIHPEELFDVSPYADAVTQYFLRNAVNQDMGRKIKMAFSSHDDDSAFTYIHDFGFIPRVKEVDGVEQRGFKVVVAGGLGAQAMVAHEASEFLPEDQVIPFIEAGLRIFDRYGERQKRAKARMKFLMDPKKGLGLEKFLQLVEEERVSLPNKSLKIDVSGEKYNYSIESKKTPIVEPVNADKYANWVKTNTFNQRQDGLSAVMIKLPLGNIMTEKVYELADIIDEVALDDIRITVNQGFLLRNVAQESLPYVFNKLEEIGLAEYGFDSIIDITACPGTDTCNLGVTNSTDVSVEIENFIKENYHDLIHDSDIKIKISGCMNSCGQHMIANVGFHGSSIRKAGKVIPALQVVMGGGVDPEGKGFIAEKVIKLPSKRILKAMDLLLSDYQDNANEEQYYNDYYQKQGKMYFYNLLKPLADVSEIEASDYIDWGRNEEFIPEVGVGECAGVSFDMISTILGDADERIYLSEKGLAEEAYADAIYNSYSSMIIGAKALLLSQDIACNTNHKIITTFDEEYVSKGLIAIGTDFESKVLKINKNEPSRDFAISFLEEAKEFNAKVKEIRASQIEDDGSQADKLVVHTFYKA
ncbi:nitrite reductase [Aureibacter tunicatorum]|uniref:Sulfite reductase (Ferredoxin) n=1 Tax=Aureibacter tunicatorum TaxID=866807 RepID=A0AAE4BV88_9BACT|nr:nitrite reductase [Aureibacter tunicatorum]MDR6241632.1 sulfite reductase (ferredoxin) [Aureibacter tunicatorum]BDD07252.1 ferredoxin--nitrite reductase [Aureibacter tunicatorum]